MKKILLILSLLFLVGCYGDKLEKHTKVFYNTFDTQITYIEYTKNENEFNENARLVQTEFERLHKLYDNYRNYDDIVNIKTINDNAGKEAVKVDKDILDLVILSKDAHEKTFGKVNIAMGSVLQIWHDYSEQNSSIEESETKLPIEEELKEANKHTDIKAIEVDEKNSTIYINDEKVMMNLGATAKGYATEIIAKKLEEKGVKHGSINAGGNVRTIGTPGDGREKWGIALQNPDLDASDYLEVLYLDGSWSVVTSGDYQRYFIHNGQRFHHIIDPETLYPKTLYRSASIMAKDSGVADILSTAIYLSSKEEAEKIIENYGAEAGVVWANDGEKTNTPDMDKYMKSKGAKSR